LNGKIKSDTLTANTYLGANASKEIVSVASPNIIRYVEADIISDDDINYTMWPTALNIEADVTYELNLHLVFGDTITRNGSLYLDAGAIAFTYRPIITGNINSISDANIILRDSGSDKPDDLSNEAVYTFQTAGYESSVIELRGILRSALPIPILNIKFKTNDRDGLGNVLPLVLKDYSYLKLSR
jgi:hypothetical protein